MIKYTPEEHETDECAVDYLYKAGVNPESMGDFLYRLSGDEALPSIERWISTHPDSKDRASEIWERVKTLKRAAPFHEILGQKRFDVLKEKIQAL